MNINRNNHTYIGTIIFHAKEQTYKEELVLNYLNYRLFYMYYNNSVYLYV